MSEKHAIGIDLGATNFRIGVVDDEGTILKKHMEKVGNDRSPDDIALLLGLYVDELIREFPSIIGVGVGVPGIVEVDEGILYQSPHYPEWNNINFGEIFTRKFKMPVLLDNDANMVALGETFSGAGQNLSNFILLTLGTGIGGGVIYNRKLMHGDHGFAGEFGHITIDVEGHDCNCGSRGCLEMFCSSVGLSHLVKISNHEKKGDFLNIVSGDIKCINPAMLFDFAKDKNEFAIHIWKEFGTYLGVGIASLVNAFGIFNIVIGGGISRAWDYFIDHANAEITKKTYRETAKMISIHRSELVNDAGIIGAGRSVLL